MASISTDFLPLLGGEKKFFPSHDARELVELTKGVGNFRDIFLRTIIRRTSTQRQQIRTKFNELSRSDLASELKRISHASIHPLIDELLCDRVEVDVEELHGLFLDAEMNYKKLVEFFCLRTSTALELVRMRYLERYGKSIDDELAHIEAEPVRRLLAILSLGETRTKNNGRKKVNREQVKRDAQELVNAPPGARWTEEDEKFMTLVRKRSFAHIREVVYTFEEVRQLAPVKCGGKYTLVDTHFLDVIEAECPANFAEAMEAFDQAVGSSQSYYAKRLRQCVLYGNVWELVRCIVVRQEIDLPDILKHYEERYAVALVDELRDQLPQELHDFVRALISYSTNTTIVQQQSTTTTKTVDRHNSAANTSESTGTRERQVRASPGAVAARLLQTGDGSGGGGGGQSAQRNRQVVSGNSGSSSAADNIGATSAQVLPPFATGSTPLPSVMLNNARNSGDFHQQFASSSRSRHNSELPSVTGRMSADLTTSNSNNALFQRSRSYRPFGTTSTSTDDLPALYGSGRSSRKRHESSPSDSRYRSSSQIGGVYYASSTQNLTAKNESGSSGHDAKFKFFTHGTILPVLRFDPEKDAEAFWEAVGMYDYDNDDPLIYLLVTRTNRQRQAIRKAYAKKYNIDLLQALIEAMHPEYHFAVSAFLLEPEELDALMFREAIVNPDEAMFALTEILVSKTVKELKGITAAYERAYGSSLFEDLAAIATGSDLQMLLIELAKAQRVVGWNANKALAERDARQIYKHIQSARSPSVDLIVNIMTHRSREQLREMLFVYDKGAGVPLVDVLETAFAGDFKDALVSLAMCIKDRIKFFCDCFNHYINEGDERAICRLVVSRSEIDLVEIKYRFQHTYDQSLEDCLKYSVTGKQQRLVLAAAMDK